MKVTLEKKESNQVCLEVEVDANHVTKTYDRMFKDVSKQINVPGFRKGKAPKKMIEKYVQLDMLKRDVIEHLVQENYPAALNGLEEPLETITDPKIELVSFELKQPMVFKATVEVRPEIKLGQYKDYDLEIDPLDEVNDEKVEAEIEALRKQKGELVNVEREVKENDVVIMDIKGEMEGEPIPEGSTDNLSMEIKSGNFVPGFTEQVVGAKVGEERDVDVTFPADYSIIELREKEGTFKVNVKEIKELQMPELNDVFAAEFDCNDMDALKEKVKKELDQNRDSGMMVHKQQSLIQRIVDSTEVEVPQTMLQREMFAMWQNGEGKQLEQRQVSKEVMQASWDNFSKREDLIVEGTKRIKTTLVLSEIARVENIQVTPEEINTELSGFAELYNIPTEELKKQLHENNRMLPLVDELLSLKIINWIEGNSKVKIIGEEEVKEIESKEEAPESTETEESSAE